MVEPSLEDDERTLARYALVLGDAIEAIALSWMLELVQRHAPGLSMTGEVLAHLERGAVGVTADVRELLRQDIADQRVGPLELLRRAVRFPTDVLGEAGIAPVDRDAFAIRAFPDDVYDLVPASFAAVDCSLHEPGLTWGAAKAYVHLRRRRELPA